VGGRPLGRIDALGLKDYTACETRAELNKVFLQLNKIPQVPYNFWRMGTVFWNHSSGGKFDYKIRQPDDTFLINGARVSAASFGNFSAGYMAAWFDNLGFGYWSVRKWGDIYDHIDGNSDGDLDSINDINAGYAMGNQEISSGKINSCGCEEYK